VINSVVLVVYGWKSVQPGTLSWVFPSLAAAVHAAHTMTNAAKWAIVSTAATGPFTRAARYLAKARVTGGVLLEQTGR
jgi:hypothetical protein